MEVDVVKKNGDSEPFDQDKIARVVTAAGLTPQEGFELAQRIANWSQSLGKPTVSTAEIRTKVIDELRNVNRTVADLFVQYEMTKDKGLNIGQIIDDI